MGGSDDFYEIMGLNKECTQADLKIAYKNLALKWHPDRWSASGNFHYLEESKNKFQAIQQAYSVLSDPDKRFLYDVGLYETAHDNDGMAEFMSEMAAMMTQNKPNENGESFEELKDLFEEMFQSDIESSTSLFSSCDESSSSNNRASSNTVNDNHCFSQGSCDERSTSRRKGRHV